MTVVSLPFAPILYKFLVFLSSISKVICFYQPTKHSGIWKNLNQQLHFVLYHLDYQVVTTQEVGMKLHIVIFKI